MRGQFEYDLTWFCFCFAYSLPDINYDKDLNFIMKKNGR